MAIYGGKNKILEPGRQRRYVHGVDHTGKSRALSKSGEKTAARIHHEPQPARGTEHVTTPDNIARKGAAKRLLPVQPHFGMVRMQDDKLVHLADAPPPDANPSNPAAKEPHGKRLSPTMVHPGMTRQQRADFLRMSAPAEDILTDALEAAESDHPYQMAKRFTPSKIPPKTTTSPALPSAVTENGGSNGPKSRR